jgi:predicted dehydrogenase
MKNVISWGIIGCGDVCEVKSGPAFQLVEGSQLHAVMRRNAEKAKDFAERHQVSTYYSDAEKLISDPEIDAIYVATPPSSHAYYTIEALKAGKPVYVEKPMALSYEECQTIISASEKYKIPVFVAYYRRFFPYFFKNQRNY